MAITARAQGAKLALSTSLELLRASIGRLTSQYTSQVPAWPHLNLPQGDENTQQPRSSFVLLDSLDLLV